MTMNRRWGLGGLVLLVSFLAQSAAGDTLPAIQDTWTQSNLAAALGGRLTTIQVRSGAPTTNEGYIQFPLETLPAGSDITRAYVWLYVNFVGPLPTGNGVLEVRPVLAPWKELSLKGGSTPALPVGP